jgi:alkanesulfonate monooxygenase SsuD/methylene tetrahydromethanopterin reductase-like flavin-dependent oxidoreductase (luciferase family)
VDGLAGQTPDPSGVEIWLGSQGPRSLALAGRVADGWAAPIPSYLPYEKWAESSQIIDRSAREAGRDPGRIRRIAQVVGTITDDAPNGGVPDGGGPNGGGRNGALEGDAPIRAGVQDWVDILTRFAAQGFDGFVLWPEEDAAEQARRFGEEIAPAVRERIG